ncbi:MAG: glycosyltransferase [Paludibacter sp.]|nr:glycosyltransferase [Paludibacter sp.]
MKILFISGSLEPGRDGVGDYTRRLAGELIQQGNVVRVIAYNDKYISEIENIEQIADGTGIEVLRIPSKFSSKQKVECTKLFIDEFNPEWISLQYVPFAFQDKGLPFGLGSLLKKLGEGRKCHVMFHELWVGMDMEAPIKHKLWGKVQKMIIRKMIQQLSPQVIHTQTQLYQLQLENIDFQASILPLFGNIPVKCNRAEPTKNKQILSFVIFGTIHPGAPIKRFAEELTSYQNKHQLKIKLIFIGRCGVELEHWVSVCKKADIDVNVMGEQNSERISEVLSSADWGISSTPMFLSQKSGTVTAMCEHQLQVLCVARSWQVKGLPKLAVPESIIEYKNGDLESILSNRKDPNQANSLYQIAQQFTIALKAIN